MKLIFALYITILFQTIVFGQIIEVVKKSNFISKESTEKFDLIATKTDTHPTYFCSNFNNKRRQ
jgi:hypothetical protein